MPTDDDVSRAHSTQLDRIEGQLAHVDQQVGMVLERMARVEQRQDSLGATVEAHRIQLEKHEQRISAGELHQAVQEKTQATDARRYDGRWSGLGAVGLVLLGAMLSGVAYLLIHYLEVVV